MEIEDQETMRFLVPAATAVFLALIASANGACATGQDPTGAGDDGTGDGTDSGSDSGENLPPDTDNPDSGSVKKLGSDSGSGTQSGTDSGSAQSQDSGMTAAQDSGSTASKDSGTTTKTPTDCVGTTSTQLDGESYTSACDAFYQNVGDSNPCTPGGNDCDSLNGTGGIATYCCFNPKTSSNCYKDYGGAQCVPQ